MSRVLLIEDEPTMRENYATALRLEGYEVVSAADGKTGVELAQKHQPDVIVCDVMMPVMDGYQVLEALRNDNALMNVPFIFLTGLGDPLRVREGMNLGADDYLTKPVALHDLIAAIDARLRRNIQRLVATRVIP